MHSRLEPVKEPARLVRRRFAEVVAYFEHPYANAVLEGADSVVRNVKRRACGFRDMDYFATMVYLTCGKLDLKAVTTSLPCLVGPDGRGRVAGSGMTFLPCRR